MILTPYQSHAAGVEDVEKALGLGDNLKYGSLTFPAFGLTVPVTHTEVNVNFEVQLAGLSFDTMVEKCEFRASLFTVAQLPLLKKALLCTLTVTTGGPQYGMQLWHGGPLAGGEIYRFMLVCDNYKG